MFAISMTLSAMPASAQVLEGEWNGEGIEYFAGRALLTTTSDTGWTALSALRTEYEVSLLSQIPGWRVHIVAFPSEYDVLEVCEQFEENDNVSSCEPDAVARLLSNDPHWDLQWNFRNTGQNGGTPGADIMLEEAYAITRGSTSVKIAILDSGIPVTSANPEILVHPDLNDTERLEIGCPCHYIVDPQLPATMADSNDYGHGTAVAGIALAETDNDSALAGVCPECSGVFEKIRHASEAAASAIIWAIRYADSAHHADIINLSSAVTDLQTVRNAIDSAGAHGVIFTFGSGNYGGTPIIFPATLAGTRDFVFAVGGTNPIDQRWHYFVEGQHEGSQYGSEVTVAAPAGRLAGDCETVLLLRRPQQTNVTLCNLESEELVQYLSGTSFAAPTVAGIAGLILSINSSLTPADLKWLIQQSADNVYGGDLPNDSIGFGRVNAFKALLRTPGWKELQSDLTIRPHIYDDVSPYVIVDQLVVPEGKTLTILPGVRLLFQQNASLEVYGGVLIAEGTEEDSIKFMAEDPTGLILWSGILVEAGPARLSHCVISGALLPFFAQNAVGDPAVRIEDSKIIGGVNGLRIWGSSNEIHEIKRVEILDVPNLTNYGGLYFLNTNVSCVGLEVRDSGYRTGYIVGTTGEFTDCLFEGAASNYGLAFSGSTCVPTFTCCEFNHIGPESYPAAPIWCLSSAAPVFGVEEGDPPQNNMITDDTPYLVRFAGTGGKPVFGRRSNRFEQEKIAEGGKFFIWDEPRSGEYDAKVTYWFVTPSVSYFTPSTSIWNFASYLEADPGLCPIEAGPMSDDDAALDSGAYYERSEAWQSAQAFYLALAANDTLSFSTRFMAGARAIAVDRRIDELSATEVGELAEVLKRAAASFDDSLAIERMRLLHLTDEEDYTAAISGHTALLALDLSPEDSLLTVIDILHTQLLSGESGSLDENTRELGVSRINSAMDALMSRHEPEADANMPAQFALHQNFPNPFNSSTVIRFEIPQTAFVSLNVFDITGRLVATPLAEVMNAGEHRVNFNAHSLASGVYFCRMEAGDLRQTQKIVLMR